MKLTFLLLLLMPLMAFSQAKKGSIKFLDEKHGFKEIILGNNIETIASNVKPLDNNETPGIEGITMYDVTNPDILTVGNDIKLTSIRVGVFKGKITYIFIKSEYVYGTRLDETFRYSYGAPTLKPNQFMDKWIWKGKNTVLSADLNNKDLGSFIFIDLLLQSMLKAVNNNTAHRYSGDI